MPNGIINTVAIAVTRSEPQIKGKIPKVSLWKDTGIQRNFRSSPKPGSFANGNASFARKVNISITTKILVEAVPNNRYLISFSVGSNLIMLIEPLHILFL